MKLRNAMVLTLPEGVEDMTVYCNAPFLGEIVLDATWRGDCMRPDA